MYKFHKSFWSEKIEKKRISNGLFLSVFTTIMLAVSLMATPRAAAKVYLDIYSPNIRKINLAVLPPRWQGNVIPNKITPPLFENRVTRDLWITGFFNIISGKEIPAAMAAAYRYHNHIDLKKYKTLGAEFVLATAAGVNQGILTIEYHLFDVALSKEIAGARLKGPAKYQDRVYHAFENKIIYYITGSDGLFDTKIAYVSTKTGNKEIYTIDFDARHVRRVTHNGSINLSPRWSPDGNRIAFTCYLRRNPDLYIIDFKMGKIFLFSHQRGLNTAPAWSPDGRYLAVTMRTSSGAEIFLLDRKGRKVKQLTKGWGDNLSAAWSPDGKKIAFVSNRTGRPQIYTMNADGTNVKRLTFRGTYNVSPAWSPRGDRIAYSGIIDGKFQICTITLDGSTIHVLTSLGNNQSPNWSPDGRYIAYSQATRRGVDIFVMNFDGNFKRRLTHGGGKNTMPSWSPHLEKP